MGKSESGPDMLDCAAYLHDIQKGQKCSICVLLELDGYVGGQSYSIGVVASSVERLVDGPVWSAAVQTHWPTRSHKHFEGALFAALASLDAEIARKHFQAELGLT